MLLTYTPLQFTEAITRELAKRATTYPKIIKKKRDRIVKTLLIQGKTEQDADHTSFIETIDEVCKQKIQYELLGDVKTMLETGKSYGPYHEHAMLNELNRELKMRKRVYPRFVYFKRIKPEVAEQEIAIWAALCEHFKENYCQAAAQ